MRVPLISIIIPVFNRQDVFARAVESVVNQTYKNIEIIVVDDGSEPAIRIPNSDARIQIFRQKNQGAPAARNFGFTKSSGELVIFWDADVIAKPQMIEKMYQALCDNPSASYAYCDFYFGQRKMPAQAFDPAQLKKINYITTTSLILRADFPGFDESLKKFQDWDLWLTMLEKNKTGVYVPEYLFSAEAGGTMSGWLPSFSYRAPWKWLPGIRSKVVNYKKAKNIIIEKHHLASAND